MNYLPLTRRVVNAVANGLVDILLWGRPNIHLDGKRNVLDGDGKVRSRVRRGFMSLRVVLQMLTWPHKSYTCGDDKFYPLIRYLRPWRKGIQVSRKLCGRCSSLGGVRVPWMLTWCRISPGRWRSRRLLKGWMREKMEDVRGPRRAGCHVLTAFHWWCEGDKLVTVGVLDLLWRMYM